MVRERQQIAFLLDNIVKKSDSYGESLFRFITVIASIRILQAYRSFYNIKETILYYGRISR